jgi:hypothetical protein
MKLFLVALFLAASSAYPLPPNECDICVNVITSVQNYLSHNNTGEELKTQLDSENFSLNKICNLFGMYSDKCKVDVKQFTSSFVELMTSEEYSAEEICAELGVCYDEDLGPAPVIIDCNEAQNRHLEYCQHLIYENGPGVVPIIKPVEL